MKNIDQKKMKSSKWFIKLQNRICKELEDIEQNYGKTCNSFSKKVWTRNKTNSDDLGGGEMRVLRGKVFEKAGVNVSTVFGSLSEKLIGKIPGTEKKSDFWASGISLVIHPLSPKVPAIHMNTRFIATQKSWFGGGIDLTPSNKESKESLKIANFFHNELKNICEAYKVGCYEEYKKWCDDYFFLPHRNESRGLGGIFFDYLDSSDWDKDMAFIMTVGETFLRVYRKIIEDTVSLPWDDKDKKLQLHRRARYVEFNLLYDRGTKFGLETNGNIEAIFMSLPPIASW